MEDRFRRMKFEKIDSKFMPTWVKYYTPFVKLTVCQIYDERFLIDIVFMGFKITLPGFYDIGYIIQLDKLNLK